MDQRLQQLEIRTYGVGVTTLEEVFLKVGKQEEEAYEGAEAERQKREAQLKKRGLLEEEKEGKDEVADPELTDPDDDSPVAGYSLSKRRDTGRWNIFARQFEAQFKSRFLIAFRAPRTFLVEVSKF